MSRDRDLLPTRVRAGERVGVTTRGTVARLVVVFALVLAATSVVVLDAFASSSPSGHTLYVRAAACSDARSGDQARSPSTPVCTITAAARLANPGDTIAVAAGTYPAFRVDRSGSPGHPIAVVAQGPVVVDARGGATALKLMNVHDVTVTGVAFVGASQEDVWLQSCGSVVLERVAVQGSAGAGIELDRCDGVTVDRSSIAGNQSAGIQELRDVTGARYTSDTVTDNGHGPARYNGDGIQLAGRDSLVSGSTILRNGSDPVFEHGIYASSLATGYTIVGNQIQQSSGADVKAAGSGRVSGNVLGSATLGIYVADNGAGQVVVDHNVVTGHFAHGVLLAGGAHATLANNTVANAGGAVVQPTDVLVAAGSSARVLDNLLVVSGAGERPLSISGVGAQQVRATLVSDGNWLATPDPRVAVGLNGYSVPLAWWQAASGMDRASLVTTPPVLGADGSVLSADDGRGRGVSWDGRPSSGIGAHG